MHNEPYAKPPSNTWAASFAAIIHRRENTPRATSWHERKESEMRQLNYELKHVCQRNRDRSYATQIDRERTLSLIANQLYEMGYRHMSTSSLKPKHVEALVARWKAEGLSLGTIKNRMTHLRWWAEKIAKPNVIARANDAYGIADRVYVTNVSKARELTQEQLERITDPYTRMSLRLEAQFGVRREESIKINLEWADRGDKLVLKDSWTKGGRAREIPIRTPEQRALVDEAKQLANGGSLITEGMTYKQQLTGWECPARGGPRSKQLTPEQKTRDREARLVISAELGHHREQVTAVYLGR
jgi:hypothetical protein